MGVQLHSTIQKQLSNNNCTIPRILDGHVVEMKRCDWLFTIGCIIISFIGDCVTVKSIYNQKTASFYCCKYQIIMTANSIVQTLTTKHV